MHKDYRLRPLELGDLETVYHWRNSDHIRNNMFSDHIITIDEHYAWFEKITRQNTNIYLVFEQLGAPFGLVYFTQIDRNNNKCYWGFYLGNEDLPPGTGSIMGYLGLEYVFGTLGIRKLCAEVLLFNARSVRFHQKLGFIEEGHLVKHILKNGKFEDILCFALFKEQWDQIRDVLSLKIFSTMK